MGHAHLIVARRRLRARQGPPAGRALSLILVAVLAVTGISVVAGALTAAATFFHYNRGYVPIEQLLVERQSGITRVYDRTGQVEIGVLSNPQAPLLHAVELGDIAPSMVDAIVSTEDKSFWSHSGVNVRGVARAAWENYLGGGIGSGSGGSSITQQLVKNVYICGNFTQEESETCVAERTVDRKLREMAYALRLEQDYSKDQILNWYLNQISYGDRYVGVQAAAQGYLRKDARDLTLAESALLAGIPSAPTTYHPRLNCERDENDKCIIDDQGRVTVGGAAKDRQLTVLDGMVKNGYITPEQAAEAAEEPLLVYAAENIGKNQASAFIDNQVEPRLVRMCEAGLLPRPDGAEDCVTAVNTAGWSVTTTLDWQKTQAAQAMIREAIAAGLEDGCNCYNAAIATIDPTSGQIVVYAPNSNPADTSDPRVAGAIDQLAEVNQPGSSFKPAVYLAWFDILKRAPLSVLWDTSPIKLTPGEDAVPEEVEIENPRSGERSEGLITARAALGGSQNVPAFRAAQEVGIDNVIQMGWLLGITTLEQGFDPTFVSHESVVYGPTIATGGANIRAIDMAVMNATIANMGVMVGLPHNATYLEDMSTLRSTSTATGEDYEIAMQQKLDFQRGHLRLPGTRELDPIAVLEVRDASGAVIYTAPEPERRQVVDPGSVWLLHSIMSDCEARFIIWQCGSSNDDTSLDVFVGDQRVPMGVKTGTQQGPLSADDTLETWMNGYTRHAATTVWVGNATNELVNDGASHGFAAAHTVLWLFKDWMAAYHQSLLEDGSISTISAFDDIRPANVALDDFSTPTTEGSHRGGCSQRLEGWQRTDVEYESQCEGRYVILPEYKRDEAIQLARRFGIPTRATQPPPPPRPQATSTATPSSTVQATPPPPPSSTPSPGPATPTPASDGGGGGDNGGNGSGNGSGDGDSDSSGQGGGGDSGGDD